MSRVGEGIMDRRRSSAAYQTLPDLSDRWPHMSLLRRVLWTVAGAFVFCQRTALWGGDLIVAWKQELAPVKTAEGSRGVGEAFELSGAQI